MLATGGGLLAVLALILINGFFVAAEFALVRVRLTRVDQLVEERRAGSGSARDAVSHLDSYIAACQLGITIASIALGWVAEPLLAGLIEPAFGTIGANGLTVFAIFGIITVLHVVAGELAPKGIALQHPERTALAIAGPLRLFRAIFRPVIWLLNESGWLVARAVGVSADVSEERHLGTAELLRAIEASTEAGELDRNEQFLLARVLRFQNLTVEHVMIPRTELLALRVETSTAEAKAFVQEHRHSRYPVYRDSIDNVVGVLHVRDLVHAQDSDTLQPLLLRQPLMVPTQANVNELLQAMRERKTHFAIAVDEYGGTDGIVTLEDVLEEIVGELQDEFEDEAPVSGERPGGIFRIDGLDNVDLLGELLHVEVEEGPYNTVAGYVVEHMGRIPQLGDSVDIDGYRLTVVEMDDLRVAVVEAVPTGAAAQQEQSG